MIRSFKELKIAIINIRHVLSYHLQTQSFVWFKELKKLNCTKVCSCPLIYRMNPCWKRKKKWQRKYRNLPNIICSYDTHSLLWASKFIKKVVWVYNSYQFKTFDQNVTVIQESLQGNFLYWKFYINLKPRCNFNCGDVLKIQDLRCLYCTSRQYVIQFYWPNGFCKEGFRRFFSLYSNIKNPLPLRPNPIPRDHNLSTTQIYTT